MMKTPRIQGNPSIKGLTGLNWNTFGANGWLIVCYMQLISILMEINWILKIIFFGSNPSTDNIINLMFEAQRGRPKFDDRLT